MAGDSKIRPRLLLATLLILGACGDDLGPALGRPAAMEMLAGDGQQGVVTALLPETLLVRVVDPAGEPVGGVRIQWTLDEGGGSIVPVGPTDADGMGRATWRLGQTAGTYAATARVSGVPPLTFHATALPGPLTRVAVQPRSFILDAFGDTVRLAVFAADAFGNAVVPEQVAWRSLDPSVATVDEAGLVQAVSNGESRIVAQAAAAADTVTVRVEQRVATLGITPRTDTLRAIGDTLQLQLDPRDRNGHPVEELEVRWSSLDDEVVEVDGEGRVVARGAGTGRVTASSGSAADTVVVVVQQEVAALEVVPDLINLVVGDAFRFTARALDVRGAEVPGVSVTWRSSDPPVATVNEAGLARALSPGVSIISAESGGLTGTATLNVVLEGATITAIEPDTLVPGGIATIHGTNFAPVPERNVVHVDGVRAAVQTANASRLVVRLPPRNAFRCDLPGAVTVAVNAAGLNATRSHTLAVAAPRRLAPGESVLVLDAGDVRCNELLGSGGRYLIAVINTEALATASAAFQLRGAAQAASALARVAPVATPVTTGAPFMARTGGAGAQNRLHPDPAVHHAALAANRRLFERRRPRRGAGDRGDVATAAFVASHTPGDVIRVRVPAIRADDPCETYTEVNARAVFVGNRVAVYEDLAAPLARTADEYLEKIGNEVESLVLGLIQQNFGDPLAMDPHNDGDGRVRIVFTRAVNQQGGLLGFAFAGDFFDRETCAASDRGEILYAVVPTEPGSGFIGFTRENWYRFIRASIVHELKHVAAIAERFARSAPRLEEVWLEEATAMAAEEIWARHVHGLSPGSNADHRATLFCEVRPTTAACAGRPVVMLPHFERLYDYYATIESSSPLGPVATGDVSFYGSAWSLVRWAADHFAPAEAAFFGALTRETQLTGVANLEARTGRTFPELLALWALASAVDDRPGFAAGRPELRLPSWNTRDIFAGLNADFPGLFPRAFPLMPRELSGPDFLVVVSPLRGGTASLFELAPGPVQRQLLELRSSVGGPPPSSLRLAILRIE